MLLMVYNKSPQEYMALNNARQMERGGVLYMRHLQEQGLVNNVLNLSTGGNGRVPHNVGSCGGYTCILFGYSEQVEEEDEPKPKKSKKSKKSNERKSAKDIAATTTKWWT